VASLETRKPLQTRNWQAWELGNPRRRGGHTANASATAVLRLEVKQAPGMPTHKGEQMRRIISWGRERGAKKEHPRQRAATDEQQRSRPKCGFASLRAFVSWLCFVETFFEPRRDCTLGTLNTFAITHTKTHKIPVNIGLGTLATLAVSMQLRGKWRASRFLPQARRKRGAYPIVVCDDRTTKSLGKEMRTTLPSQLHGYGLTLVLAPAGGGKRVNESDF
jgi:hypothetical protein